MFVHIRDIQNTEHYYYTTIKIFAFCCLRYKTYLIVNKNMSKKIINFVYVNIKHLIVKKY